MKIIKRTGDFIYLPYALHPVTNFIEESIRIVTEDHIIIIKGDNLDRLADWMGKQKVEWIRESNTRQNYKKDIVFVENILIRDRE